MEENSRDRRNQPKKRKVLKEGKTKKRRKKSQRKEKKKNKNIEKKTRSGCTYSPYESYLERIGNNSASTSQTPERLRISRVGSSRKVVYFGSEKEMEKRKISKIVKTKKMKKKSKSVQSLNTNRLNKSLYQKNGKKRGRRARSAKVSSVDVEWGGKRKPSILNTTRTDRFLSGCKNVGIDSLVLMDSSDILYEGIEESLVQTSFNLTLVGNTYLFPTYFSMNEHIFEGTIEIQVNSNEIDRNEEECLFDNETDMKSHKPVNLFDWVYIDPELCHSISEKEFGSCTDYGCKFESKRNYHEEKVNKENYAMRNINNNCMFTDTDKYIFKSCFKNIESQIQHFDRYRGAETPGGEASLYDINEVSPLDNRKLYRKNFSGVKLSSWYNYVYHSAQLAKIDSSLQKYSTKYGSFQNILSSDAQYEELLLTTLPSGSRRYGNE